MCGAAGGGFSQRGGGGAGKSMSGRCVLSL